MLELNLIWWGKMNQWKIWKTEPMENLHLQSHIFRCKKVIKCKYPCTNVLSLGTSSYLECWNWTKVEVMWWWGNRANSKSFPNNKLMIIFPLQTFIYGPSLPHHYILGWVSIFKCDDLSALKIFIHGSPPKHHFTLGSVSIFKHDDLFFCPFWFLINTTKIMFFSLNIKHIFAYM